MITEERIKISSSNLVYICNMELWICLYKLLRIAKLMTSSGPKRSQILNGHSSVNIWAREAIKSSTCRKLDWLSIIKADFGKYAISDSPFICYLPKLKILASMFAWRFVTCQNWKFWQVCSFDGLLLAKIFNFGKYVRLTVCLSVCLSVCL